MAVRQRDGYRLCTGITRRDTLRVGALGLAGFGLADLLQLRAEAAPSTGRAKSIVMIHLGGGPSHLDTYDPKDHRGNNVPIWRFSIGAPEIGTLLN